LDFGIFMRLRLIAQESADMRGLNHFYNLEYDQALAEFETAEQQDAQAYRAAQSYSRDAAYREITATERSRPNWFPETILFFGARNSTPAPRLRRDSTARSKKPSNWRTPGWRAIPTIVRRFTAAAPLSACVRIMNSW